MAYDLRLEELILRNRQARNLLKTEIRDLPKVIGVHYGYIRPLIDKGYERLHQNGYPIPRWTYFSDGYGVDTNHISLGLDPTAGNPLLLFLNDAMIQARYLKQGMIEQGFVNGRSIVIPKDWSYQNILMKRIVNHETRAELMIAGYELEKDERLAAIWDFNHYPEELPTGPGSACLYLHFVGSPLYHEFYENKNPHEELAGELTALDFDFTGKKKVPHGNILRQVLMKLRNTTPKVTEPGFQNKLHDLCHTLATHLGIEEQLESVREYTGIKYSFQQATSQ